MADFLTAHPELQQCSQFPSLHYAADLNEILHAARIPGAKKVYHAEYLYIEVPILPGFSTTYFIGRNVVCTPTKTEDTVIPAQPERIVKKVLEWECHPLLKPSEEKQIDDSIRNSDGREEIPF